MPKDKTEGASGEPQADRPAASGEAGNTAGKAEASEGVIGLLRAQHKAVRALLSEPGETASDQEASQRLEAIRAAFLPHTIIEEEFVLPAVMATDPDQPDLAEAALRRDIVKLLLADTGHAAACLDLLAEALTALIALEERPGTGLLARAGALGLDEMRPRIERRLEAVQSHTEEEFAKALEPASLRFGSGPIQQEYSTMPGTNNRERDENGRFMSDDDRRDDRRYSSRSSRYDDDERRGGASEGRGWHGDPEGHSEASRRGWEHRDERDEQGRFMSDDERRYSSRSSRYDDDDDRRGHGGWFGDRSGHSEAAHRGWEHRDDRGYSSRSSRYDDDRGRGDDRERDAQGRFMSDDDRSYSSRSSRYDDDRGRGDDRGRDEQGRFMSDDDRRYSSRSSRYDDDDRGRGNDRERDENGRFMSEDDRRYSSRSGRRDDGDDRSGRGGHGGWFSDGRGHSEASRRGWENRR